ncbi:MAG: Bacterial regulatory s, luxR family protein [Bacteroidetes bacterium]|nr:Bacterial regulatory s, luxR family protein [Bacteroidota bacterium]
MTIKENGSSDFAKSSEPNNSNHYKNTDFISALQSEIQTIEKNFEENTASLPQSDIGLFTVLPANDWIEQAKARPIPKMLFSEFWYEGEVCILFADTNLGKSILAVQIANSISKGEPIPAFKLDAGTQKVLYFDFELTDKQFQNRYSKDYQNPYQFSDNLFRIEINPDSEIPDGSTFEDYLNQSIEHSIIETEAKILIIDNLTYLRSETEKAKDALPLMKQLKALKNKYNLSLLILAHTPKRDLSKQLNRNDLQGSKMLINFCDSCFAIGESFTDKSIRYFKMIKARNTEIVYDADNVIECHICKPDNFLMFEFLNFSRESTHLKVFSDKDKDELEAQVKAHLESDPNMTGYAIAQKLCPDGGNFNCFKVKIARIIKKLSSTKQ